jgi:hypothetical protein
MRYDAVVKENVHLKLTPDGDLSTDIGGGITGPAGIDVVVSLDNHESAEVVIRVTPMSGVYRVTDLHVTATGGTWISTDLLRELPLRTILREALETMLWSENVRDLLGDFDYPEEEMRLRETAFAYRMARAFGDPPIVAVMEEHGVSRSTATRLVAAAREAGFLDADEMDRPDRSRPATSA